MERRRPQALKALIGVVHGELRRLAGQFAQARAVRPHAAADRARSRGVSAVVGTSLHAVERATTFLWRGGRVDAADLVDHARQRGGRQTRRPRRPEGPRSTLAFNLPIDLRVDFVRVDEAVTALAAIAPDKARVVELRYFGGLSIQDTADVMDIAPATVKRHWTFARAWLFRRP